MSPTAEFWRFNTLEDVVAADGSILRTGIGWSFGIVAFNNQGDAFIVPYTKSHVTFHDRLGHEDMQWRVSNNEDERIMSVACDGDRVGVVIQREDILSLRWYKRVEDQYYSIDSWPKSLSHANIIRSAVGKRELFLLHDKMPHDYWFIDVSICVRTRQN